MTALVAFALCVLSIMIGDYDYAAAYGVVGVLAVYAYMPKA